jgi:AcrR family transcriptional regulator
MRYKKSEISVDHIVRAAVRVLARQGYANTSLMDIAKEAGMSKGAVHYHFPTKEALMRVVLRTACEEVANRTLQAWITGGNPFESLRSSMRELWRARAELSDDASVFVDLLAQSFHDHKLREPLAEYYRFATQQVNEHIKENLEKVGLESKLPIEILPRILHALLDGLLMQQIVDPEAVHEDQVVDVLEKLAISMFQPKE